MKTHTPGKSGVAPAILLTLVLGSVSANGQFSFFDSAVQIHSFFDEGYIKSNENNFLTMDTSAGSAIMAEGGVNVSWQALPNLRFSAQAYDHYIGEMGKGQLTLDFALVDYRVKDWFGIRGGKVKTALGLWTDTQDQTFSYTWALLPQSVYPVDLRSMSIAHQGGDIYGRIKFGRKNSISYDAYAGTIPDDPRGGYTYGLEQQGVKLNGGISGHTEGMDVRWNPAVDGLFFGTSFANNGRSFDGYLKEVIPVSYDTAMEHVLAFYGEYTHRRWRFDSEYRRTARDGDIAGLAVPVTNDTVEHGWFVTGSYRISKRLEVGSYYSGYDFSGVQKPQITAPWTGPGANYIHDPALTAHFTLTRFWDLKLEGHFMNGFGGPSAHGFYLFDNPAGLKPQTDMIVIRTAFFF